MPSPPFGGSALLAAKCRPALAGAQRPARFGRIARQHARGDRAARTCALPPLLAARHCLQHLETKLALIQTLRELRTAQHLTQHSLAKRLSSSQSRIAKMEAGDSSVSVDLLLRALFALGAKPRDIANALQCRRRVAA